MQNRLRALMIVAVAFGLGSIIFPGVARTIVGQAGRGAAPAATPAPAARGAAPAAPAQADAGAQAPKIVGHQYEIGRGESYVRSLPAHGNADRAGFQREPWIKRNEPGHRRQQDARHQEGREYL